MREAGRGKPEVGTAGASLTGGHRFSRVEASGSWAWSLSWCSLRRSGGLLIMRRMTFFRVRRVEILGAHYVAPGDILTRLHVDTLASVWDPTKPLVARIATHPEIQSAVVRRKLPGTLVVEVVERVPVALVPAAGGFRVYDSRGVSLPIDPARTGRRCARADAGRRSTASIARRDARANARFLCARQRDSSCWER